MYKKENNKVFYWKEEIAQADPSTFQDLGGSYAKDNNHAYFRGEQMTDVHIKSFKYIGAQNWDTNVDGIWGHYDFAIDKDFVYCQGKKLEGSHSSSFKITHGKASFNASHTDFAEDRNNIYEFGGKSIIKKTNNTI